MTAISFGGSPFAFDPIGMSREQGAEHVAALAKQLQAAPARTHDDAVDVLETFRAPSRCNRCGKPDAAHIVKPRRSDGMPVLMCPNTRGDPDVVDEAIAKASAELDARREREILARMKLIASVRAPL